MRIISWNINGIRTVPQYHPWTTFKTWDAALRELGGDIICFQETKISRAGIGRNFGLPDSFDAFFSFPASKGGYSGVAVYTDRATALPLKVEEGLSGKVQPKPPLSAEERVSLSYPNPHELKLMEDADGKTPSDFTVLDLEGRALVLDFGLFVLFNLYCPNETSDERLPFKMNYHYMLEERVRRLVEDEGREVIVTGDMNICAAPIDHCDGHLPSNAESFYEHPARRWFQRWLEPNGKLIDVTRRLWPDRKGMYTCWNTKISARETNYGTRIDYFLVTPGLLHWIKHSDIQPSVKGSDHCPVFLDLFDEITLPSGEALKLSDAMKLHAERKDTPRLASKFWPEFQGKQTLMSNFFTKQNETKTSAKSPLLSTTLAASQETSESSSASSQTLLASAFDILNAREDHISSSEPVQPTSSSPMLGLGTLEPTFDPSLETQHADSDATLTKQSQLQASQPPMQTPRKRPNTDHPTPSSKAKKIKPGQASLSSFFKKPTVAPSSSPSLTPSSSQDLIDVDAPTSTPQEVLDSDYALARSLSSSQASDLLGEDVAESNTQPSASKEAWSTLFAPIQPPKCTVHGEPAKQFRVNKPGPNKGKIFFACARPVGPGYDRGRDARLREEVDYQYKCTFFKWASDVKRESLRTGKTK